MFEAGILPVKYSKIFIEAYMKSMQQFFYSKKGRLLVIILFMIISLAIITITYWLNNGDFKYFGRLLISTPVLVLFISLLCILIVSAYRLTFVFVPIFFLVIGIFLIVTSAKENGELSFLGKFIIDNYEIGLFSAGTTVTSLGIAFLALFVSRLKSKENVSGRLVKELDACKGKSAELESSINRLNERIEKLNKDIDNEVKG